MNVCGPGYCCCDAAEWEGDTYCAAYYGTVEPYVAPDYRYYFDQEYGVVLSVEPHEMKPGVRYFRDPELTAPS